MKGSRKDGKSLSTGTLVRKEEVAEDVFLLSYEMVGPYCRPFAGQFYMVECGGGREHLLRRPLSVHGVDESGAAPVLWFLVENVGWGTGRLCGMEPGEPAGFLGPLGNGFGTPEKGKALLVAGGIGAAPLVYQAGELESASIGYTFLAGFCSNSKCCIRPGVLGGDIVLYTEDGTAGRTGLVSDSVPGYVESGRFSAVYTCGPEPMMKKVSEVCGDLGVPCRVSLDSRMACGIGACRGCTREAADGGNLCVCADGPVFDAKKVKW